MAYSHAVTQAAQDAFLAADKPVILANHELRDATKTAEKWNTSGSLADADTVAANARGPISRVYDGFAHQGLHSKRDGNYTSSYLMLDVSTTPIEFDSFVIHMGNFYTKAGADWATMSLQIADDSAFTTNLITLSSASTLTGPDRYRFVDLDLDHLGGGDSRLYSDVSYVRIHFAFLSARNPRVREVWLGKRTQLEHMPNVPWDADRRSSDVGHAVSKSGVVTTTHLARAGAMRDVQMSLSTSDQRSAMDTFWSDSLHGTEPFYWIETPGSDPQAHLMRWGDRPDYNPILTDGINRSVSVPMREQNPFIALDPA